MFTNKHGPNASEMRGFARRKALADPIKIAFSLGELFQWDMN